MQDNEAGQTNAKCKHRMFPHNIAPPLLTVLSSKISFPDYYADVATNAVLDYIQRPG